MTMPNFLVIGTLKAGTTSLYHYLRQHPDVYMSPVKEPKFFAFEGQEVSEEKRRILGGCVSKIEEYRALFEGAANERAIGEVSPLYLNNRLAPARIHHHLPDAKLVAIVRQPVERAYSHFLHNIRRGNETCKSFSQAMREDEENRYWNYISAGCYAAGCARYLEYFPAQQFKVYLYEDFKNDPGSVMRDLFRFLGVEDRFTPEFSAQYNVSVAPKSRRLNALLRSDSALKQRLRTILPTGVREGLTRRIRKLNQRAQIPQLTEQEWRENIGFFREDILKLQELLQRDLSAWLVYDRGAHKAVA